MSNQRPGGPMEWYSADDKNSSTGSQPAGFDEERREEEERRRAEEEERRREEEERRRVEEEERRREEEERRREEEERRQSERYESNDEAQPQTGADNGSGSENSPFAGDSSEGIKDSPAARYGRDGPVAHSRTEPAGQQVDVEYDQAESDDASASVRPATESHAVYGGGAARTITRRLSSLARAGSAAGKKLAKRVAPKASNGQHPSAPSPQTSGPTTVPGQSAPPGPEPSRQTAATTPEELERRLKLSLRETSVGRTSRIAVGSPKGGVGKSSIAYALAGSIAYYTNMRVVLIDADPNFGSTRLLVPRPVSNSVVELARDADELRGLSDLRSYIAQNEKMRLDVALGPEHPYELAEFEDLSEAYGRIDSVLGEYYDVLVYDLGLGFRDSAIRSILTFCNQLLFVSDSEVIPNAMLADAITYVANVGVDLSRTTLAINHRLPTTDESASTEALKTAHQSALRRVTEIPYDPSLSRLLNQRAFHIDELSGPTRLGMLTTVAACLEGIKDTADIHSEMGVPSAGVVPAGDPDDPPSRNGRGRK